MREIKFRYRIKIKDGYSAPLTFYYTLPEVETHLGLASGIEILSRDEYTGLHDKNGKEIYEGDITCRHWDDGTWQNGKIIYDEASFLWQEIGGDERHRLGFIHPIGINTKHSEVIGNIYENPELLEKR